MQDQFSSLFAQFRAEGHFVSAAPYGSGHINDTYLIQTQTHQPDYILQRVNHKIFKNVPALMENIVRVTEHLRRKLTADGRNPDRETLTVIPAQDGKPFVQDEQGNYWRLYIFIDHTRSYDIVKTEAQASEGGKAFGRFQRYLDDLSGPPLHETIANFHNIYWRLENFTKALKADVADRVKNCVEEIEFVGDHEKSMGLVMQLGTARKIPLRVTHNDTKFNNVLLDESDHGLCVIDLDTVMPGYIHYDYSDAIRTGTNTAAEDEKDLSKVSMNMKLYRSFTEGFLGEVGPKLNEAEWESLGAATKLLPFTIGLRFLTDYLDGDTYFKTHFPEHNLQRARAQFQLVRSIMSQEKDIEKIIKSIRKKVGR
ncbi:MAG: aminoglycoside phosphotransferase family protein [Gammaproteobacteria bacterium]|nr:aminoglycoside phosphotransferase family protein [Gammaproteobacteria bacterium]